MFKMCTKKKSVQITHRKAKKKKQKNGENRNKK